MARGGYRPGAGRPKGGKHSTRTVQRMHQAALIEPLATGPFAGDSHDLLRWTYQNHTLPAGMRLEAARAAISFEKPKLAASQNFNIATSLRELVLESMQLSASGADKMIEHQPPQPALLEPKVIDARLEPMPIPPLAKSDSTVGPARGVLPGPERAFDDAARMEELLRARAQERAAEDRDVLHASQPNTRPYGSPPPRYSPRSAEAEDIARHVANIRRLRGLPD